MTFNIMYSLKSVSEKAAGSLFVSIFSLASRDDLINCTLERKNRSEARLFQDLILASALLTVLLSNESDTFLPPGAAV